MEHELWMNAALEEARKAYALGEVPIGAVIVFKDRIIARGHNMRETWHDPTAHAEMIAIKAAAEYLQAWRLAETTLYVTVEPCAMCAGAIVLARIDKLVYGTKDPKAGAVDSVASLLQHPSLNHHAEVVSGVMEAECRELMQRFFRELREKKT